MQRMNSSTRAWAAFGSASEAHAWHRLRKLSGGGLALRPPCVVQPSMSAAVDCGCDSANDCATMPPNEMPITDTRLAPAASTTACASATICGTV